jgi:hypothetical protein
MKSVWMTLQVLLVLAVLLIPAVAGEVYTWTDADGNIHITDRPPAANAPVERVIRYSSPTRTAPPPDPVPRHNRVEGGLTASPSHTTGHTCYVPGGFF